MQDIPERSPRHAEVRPALRWPLRVPAWRERRRMVGRWLQRALWSRGVSIGPADWTRTLYDSLSEPDQKD